MRRKSCLAGAALAVLLLASAVVHRGAARASDEDVFTYRASPNMVVVLNRSASMAIELESSSLDLDGDGKSTRYDLALKALFRVLNADGDKHPTYLTATPDYASLVASYRSLIEVEDEVFLSQRIGSLWFDNTVHASSEAPFQVKSPPTTPDDPPYGSWSYLNLWDAVYALAPIPASGVTVPFPKSEIVDYFSHAVSEPATDNSAACRPKVVLLITDGSDVASASLNDMVLDGTYSMFILGVGVDTAGNRNRLRRLITRQTSTAVDETSDETGGAGYIAFFENPDDVETSTIFHNIVSRLTASTFEFVSPVVPAVRTSDANLLFVASFSPATGSGASNALWPGHLRSFDLAADGSIPDPLVQNWDAATRISSASSSGRKIYTSVGGVRKDFVLNASSGVTASDLGAENDSEAAAIIDKVRSLGLGDIFHSTPVMVGPPSRYYPDLSGIEARQEFASSFSKRRRIVVFGANDGMLHGIDAGTWNASASPPGYNAGTGDEAWAFIPGFLLGKVKNFYESPLTHHYYVDSPPAVADIWIDGTPGDRLDPHLASEWRTYVIGGTGKGGAGYFALDITDPTSYSYPQIEWELTKGTGSGQSPYLGQTWSTPAIGKIRKTVIISNLEYGYDQWVAVVGAGKSATTGSTTLTAEAPFKTQPGPVTISVASTGEAPSSGQITLSWIEIKGGKTRLNEAVCSYTSKTFTTFEDVYIQSGDRTNFPATSTIVSWGDSSEGRAILVLDAASGDVLQTLTHASMGEVVAPPALVLDGNGYIERVYVGDLSGNIWRASIDNTATLRLGGSPFFSITGSAYSRKIYTKVSLAKGVGSYPLWWVYFGTGDRENPMDALGGAIFGVYDKDIFTRKGMTTTTKTEAALVSAGTFFTNIGSSSVSFPSLGTYEGWFGPLPVASEKMLSNPVIFNNNLFFTTFEPQSGDCSIGGIARVYGFGVAPGYNAGNYGLYLSSSSSTPDTREVQLSNVGIPSSPVISVGPGGVATMYLGTTGSSVKALKIPSASPSKSLRYWKELW